MSTAIAYTELGGPEVLTLIDVDVPAPGPGEVAVRVEAVGVNPLDLALVEHEGTGTSGETVGRPELSPGDEPRDLARVRAEALSGLPRA